MNGLGSNKHDSGTKHCLLQRPVRQQGIKNTTVFFLSPDTPDLSLMEALAWRMTELTS